MVTDLGWVLGEQPPVPHETDDVGLLRLLDVVRRDHDGLSALPRQLQQVTPNPAILFCFEKFNV